MERPEKRKNALQMPGEKKIRLNSFFNPKAVNIEDETKRLSLRKKLKVRTNKKGKSCTFYGIWKTFRHEEDSVTFELFECLPEEIYTDAFIRSLYVHNVLKKSNF